MTLPVRRTREMTRWDPLREFAQLSDQMNDVFESTLGTIPAGNGTGWSPPVDIEETEDAYVIDADLPGVKRDDVKVEIRDSELVITGELKEVERKGLIRRQTRRTGRFDYRVILPRDVDPDKVEATLHDGVLKLRVPKAAKAKLRQVEISTG
jgi:HSP20 family protein